MLRRDVEKFIQIILKSEQNNDFNVVFNFQLSSKYDVVAEIIIIKLEKKSFCDGAILSLSRAEFRSNKKEHVIKQMGYILHELGHIYSHSFGNTKREYKAQVWAYNKAIKLGLKSVAKEIKSITNSWRLLPKRSRYYKAYIMAKRESFIN